MLRVCARADPRNSINKAVRSSVDLVFIGESFYVCMMMNLLYHDLLDQVPSAKG
jgi:hypothetical protein